MLGTARERNVKKTHFLHYCNLSFSQLNHYLEKILEAKLIEVNNSKMECFYRTTQKGCDFLRKKKEIDELLNTIECPNGSATPYLERDAQTYK
jgi:predicted transcriptional regulator